MKLRWWKKVGRDAERWSLWRCHQCQGSVAPGAFWCSDECADQAPGKYLGAMGIDLEGPSFSEWIREREGNGLIGRPVTEDKSDLRQFLRAFERRHWPRVRLSPGVTVICHEFLEEDPPFVKVFTKDGSGRFIEVPDD